MSDRLGLKGPLARKNEVVVREMGDETLVYDLQRNVAHCLNKTAALVWQRCDGQTPVSEIARAIGEQMGAPVDEQVVWYALDQFGKDHLLEEALAEPVGLSRRQLLQRAGIAAVVAVPVVTSIVSPTAAHAGSCLQSGATCPDPTGAGRQCCNGLTCAPDPSGNPGNTCQ